MRDRVFRDPVHGLIELRGPERPIAELLETRAMQRLRRIRQMGLAWLVYPGAEHSRFSHALGALHIAQRVSRQLKLEPDLALHVKVAALCHDVGHGPFSHAWEHVFPGADHEAWGGRIVAEDGELRAALEGRARAVAADWQLPAAVIAAIPAAVRAEQPTFATTGGLHAAALCDRAGRVLAVAEDVGRHNAVDKLVGAAVAAGGLPWRERVLALTGRAGYELLEKAVLAGVPVVVAVSAPSRLAIDVAERFGVTLCGFVRPPRLNVYSHGWRVVGP